MLFRRLFRDRKDLLELYNALNGSAYENPDELDVVTMEDVIFMKMKNEKSEVYHMLLTEYDEKKHLKHTFEEGRKEGFAAGRQEGFSAGRQERLSIDKQEGLLAGRQDKLREMVQKKFAKGKTITQIANELEEDPSDIEKFCH